MELNKKQFKWESGEHIFFTSDTHWFHKNIIEFCKRPYSSVEEMNEELIKNWNSVVGEDDIVFHLGDFCFGGTQKWEEVLKQLNGKIYLILGNHDEKNLTSTIESYFENIAYKMHIYIEDKSIYLNHCPERCFAGAWRGENATWQIYGHVHSSERCKEGLDVRRLTDMFPTQYDVGVDNNNFTPISFNKLKEIIEKQQESLNLIK